jgi:hypothetical protein
MLEDYVGLIIVSKYDDDYIERYRVLHNFGKSEDMDLERHPGYVSLCRR